MQIKSHFNFDWFVRSCDRSNRDLNKSRDVHASQNYDKIKSFYYYHVPKQGLL